MMIDRKERHHATCSRNEDGGDDDTFALAGLAAEGALVTIEAKRKWRMLGDVMRGRRKAYLRGTEPMGEVVVMPARPRGQGER